MALDAKVVFGVAFYVFSVTLWGAKGCLLTLLTFFRSPTTFFFKKDHSSLPACAKDPSLGEHDHVKIQSQVSVLTEHLDMVNGGVISQSLSYGMASNVTPLLCPMRCRSMVLLLTISTCYSSICHIYFHASTQTVQCTLKAVIVSSWERIATTPSELESWALRLTEPPWRDVFWTLTLWILWVCLSTSNVFQDLHSPSYYKQYQLP